MDVRALNIEGLCPYCAGEQFIIGPRGGLAVNIKCVRCGVKWWFCPPFTPHEIDNDDAFYTDDTPVVLRDWQRRRQHDWPTPEP